MPTPTPPNDATPSPHQLVGFFEDQTELERAINDLQSVGIDRSQLSMLSSRSFDRQDSKDIGDVADMALRSGAEEQHVTSDTDIRQGRAMLSGIAGTVGGTAVGGIAVMSGLAAAAALPMAAAAGVGLGLATHVAGRKAGQAQADTLREQLEHGGIVLWVTARNEAEEERALATLRNHGVRRVAVDGVEARDTP